MKKINQIDGCHHCPLNKFGYNRESHCIHPDTEGNDTSAWNDILIWCPLPEDN